jgi:tetratricopeptide (TPR) repeat protein
LQPIAENVLLLDEALGTLLRFSLVQRKRDERTFFIHRLVQAVLIGSMDAQTQRNYAERIVKAVNQAFPDVTDYRNWPRCQQYLPHALACADLIATWEFTYPETGRLLNKLGYYLKDRAQYWEAEPLFKRAIAIGEKTLGPEHPDLAIRLNNLAMLYQDQGKYEEAEPLFKRALAIYEQKFGSAHPGTRTIRENYSILLRTMNKQKD